MNGGIYEHAPQGDGPSSFVATAVPVDVYTVKAVSFVHVASLRMQVPSDIVLYKPIVREQSTYEFALVTENGAQEVNCGGRGGGGGDGLGGGGEGGGGLAATME
jgi:hypothetical protein